MIAETCRWQNPAARNKSTQVNTIVLTRCSCSWCAHSACARTLTVTWPLPLSWHQYYLVLDPHRLRLRKMDFHLVLLLLGALAFHPVLSDIPEHMIKSLPGWDAPLPTTQYSGYIQISATKYLHYWWVVELCLTKNIYIKNSLLSSASLLCAYKFALQ